MWTVFFGTPGSGGFISHLVLWYTGFRPRREGWVRARLVPLWFPGGSDAGRRNVGLAGEARKPLPFAGRSALIQNGYSTNEGIIPNGDGTVGAGVPCASADKGVGEEETNDRPVADDPCRGLHGRWSERRLWRVSNVAFLVT